MVMLNLLSTMIMSASIAESASLTQVGFIRLETSVVSDRYSSPQRATSDVRVVKIPAITFRDSTIKEATPRFSKELSHSEDFLVTYGNMRLDGRSLATLFSSLLLRRTPVNPQFGKKDHGYSERRNQIAEMFSP
jgi:hypothetical protein